MFLDILKKDMHTIQLLSSEFTHIVKNEIQVNSLVSPISQIICWLVEITLCPVVIYLVINNNFFFYYKQVIDDKITV